jgi:hypothetical protein
MSNLSDYYFDNSSPSLIVNYASDGGTHKANMPSKAGKSFLSGSLTAGVLTSNFFTISGAGAISYLAIKSSASSLTARLKLTIDGTAVFDATSDTLTFVNHGFHAIGNNNASASDAPVYDKIYFNQSVVVDIASSVTGTNGLTLDIVYEAY